MPHVSLHAASPADTHSIRSTGNSSSTATSGSSGSSGSSAGIGGSSVPARSRSLPTEALTDLLVATGRKDPLAFEDLYRACAPRVFGMARKFLYDPDRSAEVTQEVFMLIWDQGDRYRPDLGHPMSWLMTLTHRRAVDRIRSDTTRALRDERWTRQNWPTTFDEVTETVVDRDDAARLRQSMSVLSPLQREAISLAYFKHLTYAEVALRLGIPEPTAKTRIRDGLKKLYKALGPDANRAF